jgi:DNA-binding response OmpR family regulator
MADTLDVPRFDPSLPPAATPARDKLAKVRPANSTVAVVDDEDNIRETLAFALRREGYPVELFAHGGEAWESFQRKLPGLVVLDILMPEMDGLELCRRIRSISEAIPIIFLTSRDDEIDRVLGLEIGADDYLCKPFSMRELLARVKVLFRRAAVDQNVPRATAEPPPLRAGDLELDLQRYTVKWKGLPVSLTVTEFMMLHALVRHPGHVKTRKQLHQDGYPHDAYVSDRTIDSHIKRLRRKFEEVDASFDRIETVYGLGYRYRE